MNTPRIALAATVLVLLTAGCGNGDDNASPGADVSPSSTASATPGAKPGGGSTKGTAKPTAAGVRPSSGSQTSGGSVGSSSGGSTSGAQSGTSQAATPAGAYTYDIKGKGAGPDGQSRDISGSATLRVDRPVGSKQHSVLDGEQGKTDQDLVHDPDGTKLARLKISSPVMTIDFRPSNPVLAFPRPAPVGRAWSWTMKSTDGKTTADFRAKIVGSESVTIGGVRISTVVFEHTLKLSGTVNNAPYTYTQNSRSNYEPQRMLRVKERSKITVTYSGAPAGSGDTTNTLRSLKPR